LLKAKSLPRGGWRQERQVALRMTPGEMGDAQIGLIHLDSLEFMIWIPFFGAPAISLLASSRVKANYLIPLVSAFVGG
jgi:hypothetical protein